MNASCHTHECVISHASDSTTYKSVMLHPMPHNSFTQETYIHGGEGVVTHPHLFPARLQIAQTAKRRVSTLHLHIQMSHITNMNKSCPQPYHITTYKKGGGVCHAPASIPPSTANCVDRATTRLASSLSLEYSARLMFFGIP